MVYHGHIKNGQIVLDESVRLPEGAAVRVDVASNGEAVKSNGDAAPWGTVFADLVGKAEGLPSDMARNHDHYLHGAPHR